MARSYVGEARQRVGPKRGAIGEIIERLAREHQDATIALRFRNPLELLVSVMLSAQTTDVNVNRVTETLFEKYRRPEDYLAVPQEELERDIFATGFFRQKTKAIRGTMHMLLEEFDGEVPRTARGADAAAGRRAQDGERRRRRARQPAGHRRRHARAPALAAARADEAGGPGEDRARPDQARAARGLGPLPAPADLARPARVPRAQPALRGLRADRPLPVEPRLARRERDEQPAVLVVRGEEVGGHRLVDPGPRAQRELLAEPAHAPLERDGDRVLHALGAFEPERVDDVPPDQLGSW